MDQKRPTTRKNPTDPNDATDAVQGANASGETNTEHEDAMAATREEHGEIRKALEAVSGSGETSDARNDDRAWERIAALSLRHFDIEDATLLDHLSERDDTREAACRFRVMHDLARILIANLRDAGQPREALRAKRTVLGWLLKAMFEREEDEKEGLAVHLKSSGLDKDEIAAEAADRRRGENRRNRQRPRLSVLRLDQLEGDETERRRDDERARLSWDDEWRRQDTTSYEGRAANLRQRDRDLEGGYRRMPERYDEDDRDVRPGWQRPDFDDDDGRRGSVYGRLMGASDDDDDDDRSVYNRAIYDQDRLRRPLRQPDDDVRSDRNQRNRDYDQPRQREPDRGSMRGMRRPDDDRDRFRDEDDRRMMRRRD